MVKTRQLTNTATERALTLDLVLELLAEVNSRMAHDAPSVPRQIEETQRQLVELDQAIANLLALAERFGAAGAGPRLAEREADQAQLRARLKRLTLQQQAQHVSPAPEAIERLLAQMHRILAEGDTQAKRDVLSKVVTEIKMGPTRAELSYTFPLHEVTGMYTASPWGHTCRHFP